MVTNVVPFPQEKGKAMPADFAKQLIDFLGLRTQNGVAALFTALECVQLLDKKQQDYGSRNISDYGEFGVLVRINDKLQRLRNLLTTQAEPNNESIEDTWRDEANYGIIGLLLRRGQWSQ